MKAAKRENLHDYTLTILFVVRVFQLILQPLHPCWINLHPGLTLRCQINLIMSKLLVAFSINGFCSCCVDDILVLILPWGWRAVGMSNHCT